MSHFGDSCNISNIFFTIIFVMVISGQCSLMLQPNEGSCLPLPRVFCIIGLWTARFFSGRTTVFPSSLLLLLSPDSWLQIGRFLRPAATFRPGFLKRKVHTWSVVFPGESCSAIFRVLRSETAMICWLARGWLALLHLERTTAS